MDAKQEMTQELKRARGWILAVGLIMAISDTVMVRFVHGNDYTDKAKNLALIIDVVIVAIFALLALAMSKWPRGAALAALVTFWGLQVLGAALSGNFAEGMVQGILIKILFTVALVRGYKSASRAGYLKSTLEQVFG
jgi:hypothetical protein